MDWRDSFSYYRHYNVLYCRIKTDLAAWVAIAFIQCSSTYYILLFFRCNLSEK